MFNPYQSLTPLSGAMPIASGAVKSGINWATLLSNTQKTLNIVNQAIPLVYQVKPIVKNAKTMFRIASEIGKGDKVSSSTSIVENNKVENNNNFENNEPKFFI